MRTAILAYAIALFAGGALRAQAPVVITQTVTIDGRAVTDPGVLELVETRPGKPFSPCVPTTRSATMPFIKSKRN